MSPRPRITSASPPVIGVIDIGTNAVKLMVASVVNGRVIPVHFGRRPTRLGEGLAVTGRIGATAASRTAAAVRELAAEARTHGAGEAVAVGTYALRAARNGRATAALIKQRAGVPVLVLSGKKEGELLLAAVRARMPSSRRDLVVVDIGGGSAQLMLSRGARTVFVRSVPLGAVVLTEQHLHHDPIDPREYAHLRAHIDATLARLFATLPASGPADLVVSGGAATTASYMTGSRPGSPLMRVSVAQLARLEARCLRATIAGRRRFRGMQPDRADIMPAGLAVLLGFARHARKRSLRTFAGGWREGLILERAARRAPRSRSQTRSTARRPAGARTGR